MKEPNVISTLHDKQDLTKQAGMRQGASTSHDVEMWDRLEKIIDDSDRSISDVLESFPAYVRRINLSRFLMHYELFRMIKDLPGNIVDIGVYRGVSLFAWAKFMEIFNPGDRMRRVYGFDNFAGFDAGFHEKDGRPVESIDKVQGGWNAAPFRKELLAHIDMFHEDSMVPRAKRIVLVEGDVRKTCKAFVEENPGFRVSLLHLDVDLYEPTLAALEAFYPLIIKGGIVVMDEYSFPAWAGETRAVEDYFGKDLPRMTTLPFSSSPAAYFVKE